MYIFKIFNSFLKDYKFTIIIYIIFTILAFPLESIAVPQIYSHFFENLNKKTDISLYLKYFIIIVVFLVIINTSNCITTYIESFMLPELNEFIINYIFKNLLKKYENSITEIELAKIITRISIVPQHLKEFITSMCIWVFPRLLTIIIINIYFTILDWRLGLVSIFLLILFYFVNIFFFKVCSEISTVRHKLFENKNQETQDKLSNSFSIYSTGNLNNEISKYEKTTCTYTKKFKENLFCLNKAAISNSILNILLFVVLNSVSTYLYINKKLSFTNLIAIFITIIYYIPCIITINNTLPDLIHYYGTLNAVDDFVEELYNTEIKNRNIIEENIELPNILINKGSILINNLTFGYNSNNQLFKNFYLTIKEKEKVAIIGSSGNGKSTLIKLIMGYYKLPDNTIFIDNNDINKFNLNDLRTQISYVNQNNKLFNTTLLENIQYGNNVDEEEIIHVCKKIKVDNIFKNLKEGLYTNVGIEGSNLSGGQRQLVHILRCIFKKNNIIILDEPTSAIDKDNRDNIMNAIKELSLNNTLIIITHDNTLLELVNRVIVLDAGKIISDNYK